MDSLTQIALGSAVSLAVMGRRTRPWKAALAGAVFGTIPDLDVFFDRGDALRNVTMHRAESHALFYLTLAAPLGAWLWATLVKEMSQFRHWWLAIWLVLITHPLLDALTIYGTQLAVPFSDYPFGTGSIFIIDPFYTLPLLGGVLLALILRNIAGFRANITTLVLSTAYLVWGLGAQQYVQKVAQTSLAQQGIVAEKVLVTAAPLNTIRWRILAVTADEYAEGFYSLRQRATPVFTRHQRNREIYEQWRGDPNVQRMVRFTHGFYRMDLRDSLVTITDLRMGQKPNYTFGFIVAEGGRSITPRMVPRRMGSGTEMLKRMGRRIFGDGAP